MVPINLSYETNNSFDNDQLKKKGLFVEMNLGQEETKSYK